jgi:phosphotriesterase-related protein
LRIITNTGYYGAADDKYVPKHAYAESAAQLAARWTAEFKDGIEGTSIHPGFIKIGVDRAPLSEIDARLARAAALTHRATGLTIASHTGNGAAALEQLEILKREGVSGAAFIWVHAQNEKDPEVHARAAAQGAWLEFDGIRDTSLDRHRDCVRRMKDRNLLRQVLISQDAGWYRVGEPKGGNFRDFDFLFTHFVPALQASGFTKQELDLLLIGNPARALAIAPRIL